MADPTTTPPTLNAIDSSVIDNWGQAGTNINAVNDGLNTLGQMNDKAAGFLGNLSDALSNAGVKLTNIGSLLTQDSTKFGLISTAIVGAKESFRTFNSVDQTRINSFSSQMSTLLETLSNKGTAPAVLTSATKELVSQLVSANRPLTEIQQALAGGTSTLVNYAKNVLVSADNILYLQNSMLQLTSAGGGMQDLFTGIDQRMQGMGDHFQNLNVLTAKYGDVLRNAMGATNTQDINVMYNYVAQLNKLPDGFKTMMSTMEAAGRQSSVLTAAIQYATGSGREYSEVMKDMGQAMAQYGTSGESALKFSARISEVSETLHAQMSDVQSALMGSADAFKSFVFNGADANQMTQGMADSMQNYVAQLKSVGVPVQNALSMFKNYTSQMQGMTQAQEAFLSAQSGGPGGLRGGFQIDAMMQKGDFEGIRKKVEDTLKKMTGPIVSLDQATKSDTAAAQYTRQIQILQNGPLGNQAKTRGEAEALLESMRKGTKISPTDQKGNFDETVKRGQSLEQLSMTKVGQVNIQTEGVRLMAGNANLTTLQNAMTPNTGAAGGEGGTGAGVGLNKEELRDWQKKNISQGPNDQNNSLMGLVDAVKGIPTFIGETFKSLKDDLSSGNQDKARDDANKLNAQIAKLRTEGSEGQATADSLSKMVSQTIQQSVSSNSGMTLFHPPSAGEQTGQVPGMHTKHATIGDKTSSNNQVSAGHGNQAVPVTLVGSSLTVNFTGKCQHCGWDIHDTEQARVQNAASTKQH